MKRLKHNKKRNTLFLFEILIQEMTKCITTKNEERKLETLSIIKKFFADGTELKKEKDLLSNVVYTENMTQRNMERLIFHTREEYQKLTSENIFEQQTALIKEINKNLGSDVFKTFVQKYKRIATVHQLFNAELDPKQKVLIEQRILAPQKINEEKQSLVHIDKLVFNKFVDNFNSKYAAELFEEQTKLLTYYITSFTDNGVGLKTFVNEEISRIGAQLKESLENYEISENSDLENGIGKVIEKVSSFSKTPINDAMLKDIINLQQLVRELDSDDS
jgi:hypothetical protein